MADPSPKHPSIDALITNIFGVDRQQMIRDNRCVTCGNSAGEFTDPLSEREYTISGMCQNCQNEVFTVDDSEDESFIRGDFPNEVG